MATSFVALMLALGFDEAWLRTHLPGVGWPVATVLALSTGFYAGAKVQANRSKGRVSGSPKMEIVVGKNNGYEDKSHTTLYTLMHVMLVGIKNSAGGLLSNCRVYCEVEVAEGKKEKFLCENTFSLNAGEERYVHVARYNEPVPPHPINQAEVIRLSAPPSGTFWQPPTIPAAGGIIKLIATSAECPECKVVCRVWVRDGRFQWERA
jgi:hypothetical protein